MNLADVANDAQSFQPSWGFSSFSSSFIGPYSVFYPVCLFFCDVNVQLSHQLFGGHPGGLVFYFPPLLSAGYRPSFITLIASRFWLTLFLAHTNLADVADFISQNVAGDALKSSFP